MTEDPLTGLLVDADEVDRKKLFDALKGLIGIDQESGRIVWRDGYQDLTQREKIAAYLLGKKAASLLEVDDEKASAETVAATTGIESKAARARLSELAKDQVVSRANGEYWLEGPQVLTAIGELEGE